MDHSFTCSCGDITKHVDKALSDRRLSVNRCKKCYNIWHSQHVIDKAKEKKSQWKDRINAQAEERRLKAKELADKLDTGATTLEQRYNGTKAAENKARLDKFYYDLELRMINEGLE